MLNHLLLPIITIRSIGVGLTVSLTYIYVYIYWTGSFLDVRGGGTRAAQIAAIYHTYVNIICNV